MELTDIISLLTKNGSQSGLYIIIIMILYIIIKNSSIQNLIAKLFEKVLNKKSKNKELTTTTTVSTAITESDIIHHDIFSFINLWSSNIIPTIEFSTPYRTVVFRKYLYIFLDKYKSNIQEFVDNKNYFEMDNSELWHSFMNLTNDIVQDYETEMIKQGIPKIIIEKMKAKNNDSILLIIEMVQNICSTQFYDSDKNLLKVYSILNIYLSILEHIINSAEAVCNNINGQLKGLTMDNETEL